MVRIATLVFLLLPVLLRAQCGKLAINPVTGQLDCTGTGISAAGGTNGQVQFNSSGSLSGFTMSGDATLNTGTGALTLATVNSGSGTCGDATHSCQVTTNGKGLLTAQTAVAITAGTGNAAALVQIASTTGTVAFNCPSSTAGTVVEFAKDASQNPIQLSGNITITSTGCTAASLLTFIFQQAASGGPFDITVPGGWDSVHLQQTASIVTKITFDSVGHFVASSSTAGYSQCTESAAPGSNPPAGFEYVWCDSTAKTQFALDSAGNKKKMPRCAGTGDTCTYTDLANSANILRRSCDIAVGDQSGSAITNAQLGPESRLCYIPEAATIQELDVAGDAGTPNVVVGRNHAGTITNIVSAALATAASGGIACSNTGGTLGIDGATTCTNTLQNTSLSAGDYLELVSGTAGGTAKLMTMHVIYTVN